MDAKKTGETPLYGLVLVGGKSQRMQQDKSLLAYHGMPQRDFLIQLLQPLCEDVFLSCRKEQAEKLSGYQLVLDEEEGKGPLAAIYAAFKQKPDAAWLVVACDLPLLDAATLTFLVEQRDVTQTATTYQSPAAKFPEPLITIWEPAALAAIEAHWASGEISPRALLGEVPIKLLQASEPKRLMNVNHPEEFQQALDWLALHGGK